MIAKMGNSFPLTAESYSAAVASALSSELGLSHRAIKTLRNWTNASERTTKNWLAGTNGPSGLHLIAIMRHSDKVLSTVLELAQRKSHLTAVFLPALKERLIQTAELIDASIGSDR
ncbi:MULTISPECIES: hypothetical protein [Pseudomonas]|uniref:hypothetical protein n=1 Tax=Pseudomonas TaxID=286 RepID=UPI0023E3EB51|nr:hypothetical protein [Pseudomonas putida]MDF3928933.1 hypothetical protein [Pseudomonas putida]